MDGWVRNVPCRGFASNGLLPKMDIHVETVDDDHARVTFVRQGPGSDEPFSLVVDSGDYASVLIDMHDAADGFGMRLRMTSLLTRTVRMACHRDCIESSTVLDSEEGKAYRMLRGLELDEHTGNPGYLPLRSDGRGKHASGADGWVRVLLDMSALSNGTDAPLFHMEIIFDGDHERYLIGGFTSSEILDALARYHTRSGVSVNGIVEEIILMTKLSQPSIPLRVLTEDARASFPTLRAW